MKKIKYNLFFDNHFTAKDWDETIYLPFWWSDKRIVAWLLKHKEPNHSNICSVKVWGKIIWEHTYFRNKDYKGIQEKGKELLLQYTTK